MHAIAKIIKKLPYNSTLDRRFEKYSRRFNRFIISSPIRYLTIQIFTVSHFLSDRSPCFINAIMSQINWFVLKGKKKRRKGKRNGSIELRANNDK